MDQHLDMDGKFSRNKSFVTTFNFKYQYLMRIYDNDNWVINVSLVAEDEFDRGSDSKSAEGISLLSIFSVYVITIAV